MVGFFNPDNVLVKLNQQLYSNILYNGFQFVVTITAVFTGPAYANMRERMKFPPTCFVAGTMILTASGLVAIENIKAGDKVVATNPDSFEIEKKTVVETYVHETSQLIHLTIYGETITTTWNHPFYVKDRGFINAEDLQVGDQVVSADGEIYTIENHQVEIVETPETVYNFQVEDFHTYHVGNAGVLVHNADCTKQIRTNAEQGKSFEETEYKKLIEKDPDTVGQITIKVNETGEKVRVDFASGSVENGTAYKLDLIEAKSSNTATFTKKQQKGYPNLAKNGGIIVGKGKGNLTGGTIIPPTEVNVLRPSGISPLFSDILGKNLGGK